MNNFFPAGHRREPRVRSHEMRHKRNIFAELAVKKNIFRSSNYSQNYFGFFFEEIATPDDRLPRASRSLSLFSWLNGRKTEESPSQVSPEWKSSRKLFNIISLSLNFMHFSVSTVFFSAREKMVNFALTDFQLISRANTE